MSLMLKVMSPIPANLPPELAPYEDEREYSLFADITSCHFRYFDTSHPAFPNDGVYGEAHLWVREPVKTAEVPGYCEVEKHVALSGEAFVMNEQGRTISVFRPKRPLLSTTGSGQTGP